MNSTSAEPDRRDKRIGLALFAAACAGGFAIVFLNAWVTEDAYITFRVVDNFVHGFGLRWNIDERVQPYTHPLWMLLHVPLYALSGNIFLSTIALSLVCTVLAVWIGARAADKSPLVIAALWIVPLALSKAFTEFSTSGLESPLTFLLFAVFVRLVFRAVDRVPWLQLSVVVALAACNRSDTLLVYAPVLLALWWSDPARMPWRAVLLGSAPFIAWEVFSLIYYGFPFPNTKYAKLNTGIAARDYVEQGWYYLADLFWMDLTSVCVLGLGLVTAAASALSVIRRVPHDPRALRLASLGAGCAAYIAYVIWIGGDFMSGRFWVFPVFVAAWVLCARAPRRISLGGAGLILACLGGVKLVAHTIAEPVRALSMHKVGGRYALPHGIADERAFYAKTNAMIGDDFTFRSNLEPLHTKFASRVVAKAFIGMMGFYAGPEVIIVDPHALSDPLLARLPVIDPHHWRIGHFKREVPAGYLHARATGDLARMDAALAEYYSKLRSIVAGDVWSAERFRTIAEFNLGRYDHLIRAE